MAKGEYIMEQCANTVALNKYMDQQERDMSESMRNF